MQDTFNLVMLVLVSVGSMCLGVLAAYALVKGAFSLMHWHAMQQAPAPVKTQPQVARVS